MDNPQTMLWGTIETEGRYTRDQLVQRTMNILAIRAGMANIAWNCFNVNLILKPVKAQKEPEHEST